MPHHARTWQGMAQHLAMLELRSTGSRQPGHSKGITRGIIAFARDRTSRYPGPHGQETRPSRKDCHVMAVVLVTYDLQKVEQNYHRIHDYLKSFSFCKQLEWVWLLDTTESVSNIRDRLKQLVDREDIVFVAQLERNWASVNYPGAEWLNDSARRW